ncbi:MULTISPECIES: DNA repair protein RecO [unclassified Sphingomonas]|uniref:DNA repair protein RecO n=1 Tax=unclassified Sphingomonas TaxID=196159 RepID=UPI001F576827|nr:MULTISPECIES: DNA repair protein RecO [unclassified Sphingomonas]
MHIVAEAIVLAVRLHGENGAVVRALTRDDGLQPGYVRGGRSRQLRPVLLPANLIRGEWRARTGEQLAGLVPELLVSRAALHGEPLAADAIAWACALTAAVLPEAQRYPRVYDALGGLLDAVAAAPAARDWAAALARYELLLLAELGFGLDLDSCVATGATSDLAYVSPRSGAAVSAGAAMGYEAKLLPLPDFLRLGGAADWPAIFAALRITGHFLERDLLIERQARVAAGRARLIDRLKRAVA